VKVILEKANSALGEEGYNVIYGNCEHFATDCRYGQSTSRQVKKLDFRLKNNLAFYFRYKQQLLVHC
jgi:hypothetical protein